MPSGLSDSNRERGEAAELRRVAVTGGYGFIGSSVVKALQDRGVEARPLDIHTADVRNADAISAALCGCDGVVHLAGLLGTDELFDAPHDAVQTNISGTLNVLGACRDHSLRYVGITMPHAFPSIYTATKIGATSLASAYHHAYGVPVSHVRAFNVFGPGQAHGPTHPRKLIPSFAVQAWRGEPLEIWGDGHQTVDLIDSGLVGEMLVDALSFGDDQVFDAGTGVAHTVAEVAEMVLQITGSLGGSRHRPMRRGEVPTRIVASGEGWDLLGWRPVLNVSMLEATVHSYRQMAEQQVHEDST